MSARNTEDRTASAETRCLEAIELLPWLLNGTLEEEERRELLDHLKACEGCRLELDETATAWGLLNQHIPSLALAEYANGLVPGIERQRIEKHLAICSSCNRELEMATPDQVVDLDSARIERSLTNRRRSGAAGKIPLLRRRWGIAASLLLAAVSGTLLFDLRQPAVQIEDGKSPVDIPRAEVEAQESPGVFIDGFESGVITAWPSATVGHQAASGADS